MGIWKQAQATDATADHALFCTRPLPPSRFTCDFWGRGQRMRVAGAKHCGQCTPAVKCHLLWSVQGLAALIKASAWILNPVLTSSFRSRLS